MMKYFLLLISFVFLISSFSISFAKEEGAFFERVKISETEETLSLKLLFTKKEKLKYKVSFFERLIQVEITPAFITAKKRFRLKNEMISEVQVYAFQPKVIRVRLYLKKDGNSFKDTFRVRIEGSSMIFYLNKKEPLIEKVLEKKIVHQLDKEILSALSEVSREESKGEMQPENWPADVLESEKSPSADSILDKGRINSRETFDSPPRTPEIQAVTEKEKAPVGPPVQDPFVPAKEEAVKSE
ncbi:MAG: hypothetical protein ACE5FU_09595 [Nitrospinota bacterium]